jgi:hypothetical protein
VRATGVRPPRRERSDASVTIRAGEHRIGR